MNWNSAAAEAARGIFNGERPSGSLEGLRALLDHFVDAIGAVNDGEFGVEPQVHKHGWHCRKAALLQPRSLPKIGG